MTQRFILLAAIVAAMFAMTGCGDSDDNTDKQVCESICDNSRCDEIEELRDCEKDCEEFLDDVECSRQARDFFECLDDNNCDFEGECVDEARDWGECVI